MALPGKRKHDEIAIGHDDTDQQSKAAGVTNGFPARLSDLCAQCQALDLDDILSHPERIKNKNGARIVKDWTPSNCPFCQLLARVCPLPTSTDSREDVKHDLFAFSSRRTYEPGFPTRTTKVLHDTVLLGLVPTRFPQSQDRNPLPITSIPLPPGFRPQDHIYTKRHASLRRTGFITPLPSPDLPLPPGFRPRMVKPEVDWNFLKGWITFCQRIHGQHSETRGVRRPKQIPSLKVIDCTSRHVVMAPAQCEYVALSYVWGLPELGNDTSRVERSQGLMPKTLPRTIEDAITVVTKLEHRYLWIDRYCIDQDDIEDKHTQIKNMDLIYRGAQVTIIAAAGNNPDYGLPGVEQRLREPQPRAKIMEHYLVSTLPDPWELIKASKWKTRAWTYQEAIFSTRRLVFTDQQAYFECDNMSCCEARDMCPESLHRLKRTKTKYKGPNMYAKFEGLQRGLSSLKLHISEYSKLSLTYQSDILNGMLGIFRACQEFPVPLNHYWGIPIMLNTRAETPESLTAGFLRGLTWRLSNPSRRRPGYPSWSWTGWVGSAEWQNVYDWLFVANPEVAIHVVCEEEPISWEDIQQRSMKTGFSQGLPTYLEVETWTVELQFEYLLAAPKWDFLHAPKIHGGPGFFVKCNPQDYSPLVLCKEAEEGGNLHRRLQMECWQCMVIGTVWDNEPDVQQKFGDLFLLVLDGKGPNIEKIGHVDLRHRMCNDWKDVYPSRPRALDLVKVRRRIRLG